jgi:hypothetical protein
MIGPGQRQQLLDLFAKFPNHSLSKYFPIDWELSVAEERCDRNGLNMVAGDAKRVLDLGGGLGYFVHAVAHHGHDATLIDVDDPLITEAADILGIRYIPWVIRDDEVWPSMGKFDLVTMHRVNVIQNGTLWNRTHLLAFGEHVLTALSSGGQWHIDPNNEVVESASVLNVRMWEEWLGSRGTAALNELPSGHPRSIAGPGRAITITKRDNYERVRHV